MCKQKLPQSRDGVMARRPFPLLDQLPDALHGVVLNYLWEQAKLHTLIGLCEVTVPVCDLAWHLELPFWAEGGEPFKVCPFDVASDRDKYSAQWDRTMSADLRFPLHVRIDLTGKIVIIDGIHRLLKALILNLPTVSVLVLTDDDLNRIAVFEPVVPRSV